MWITLKDECGNVVMDTKMTNREMYIISQAYKISRRETIAFLARHLGIAPQTAQKYMRDGEREWAQMYTISQEYNGKEKPYEQ